MKEAQMIEKLGLEKINIVVFDNNDNVISLIYDQNTTLHESGEDNRSYLFDMAYMFFTHIQDKSSSHKKEVAGYFRAMQRLNKNIKG